MTPASPLLFPLRAVVPDGIRDRGAGAEGARDDGEHLRPAEAPLHRKCRHEDHDNAAEKGHEAEHERPLFLRHRHDGRISFLLRSRSFRAESARTDLLIHPQVAAAHAGDDGLAGEIDDPVLHVGFLRVADEHVMDAERHDVPHDAFEVHRALGDDQA